MTTPKIVRFNQVPKTQVRITMPDGTAYGVVAQLRIPQEILDEVVKGIVENENNRRHLDYVGGFNFIHQPSGNRLRLFREFNK